MDETTNVSPPLRKVYPYQAGAHRSTAQSRSGGESRFFVLTDLEDAIAQLPKVQGVRIISGEAGIEEIHIISGTDIAPKSLVRNVVTMLLVRFGVRLDHRCLSIVQSDAKPYVQVGRPVISRVTTPADGEPREIAVELRSGGSSVEGRHMLAGAESEMDGGCLALIDAIEKLLGRHHVVELCETKSVMLKDSELVVVLVTWHGSQVDESFNGSALAERGRADAAARATLDAINRKLVRLPIMQDV